MHFNKPEVIDIYERVLADLAGEDLTARETARQRT